MNIPSTYSAFAGPRLIACSDIKATLLGVVAHLQQGDGSQLLIFEDSSGKQLDFDLRGTADEILARLPHHPHFAPVQATPAPRTGPGRPRLGVISREVSLLPRHWDWLEGQPQGISGALRRLVEEAKKLEPDKDRERRALEAADKFMWAMAGNLPGCEEASRALYARDLKRLNKMIRQWPKDIQRHILKFF